MHYNIKVKDVKGTIRYCAYEVNDPEFSNNFKKLRQFESDDLTVSPEAFRRIEDSLLKKGPASPKLKSVLELVSCSLR